MEITKMNLEEKTTEKRKGFTLWPLDFRKHSHGNIGFVNFNDTLTDKTLEEYLPNFIAKKLPKKYREMALPAISVGLINSAEYVDNALMIGLINVVDGYDTNDYVAFGGLNIITGVPHDKRGAVSTRFRPLISLEMSYDGKMKHLTWEERQSRKKG